MILSRLFWPAAALRGEDTLEVPPAIKEAFKEYSEQFGLFKAARALDFKPHLGSVEISLELENGAEVELQVSPMQATIISHFETQCTWPLKELAAACKVPTGVVQKRLSFWTGNGLIKHLGDDVYELDEAGYPASSGSSGAGAGEGVGGDDETASAAAQQREEEEETYWGYILGMLTSSGEMDVEGMSGMLGIFVEDGFNWTEQELTHFLEKKVGEGVLSRSGTEYAIVEE